MHCFNHNDREAVGFCKACCKGLCPECAVDLGFGLSCRGEHETRVASVERMISRANLVQDTARSAKYVTPIFLIFVGLVFATYGFFFSRTGKFLDLLGVGFLAYGAYLFFVNYKAFGKRKTDA